MSKIRLFEMPRALEAAAEIFRTKGYTGTSINELITAIGISRYNLYCLFRDKHNLFIQSMEFYRNSNYTHP